MILQEKNNVDEIKKLKMYFQYENVNDLKWLNWIIGEFESDILINLVFEYENGYDYSRYINKKGTVKLTEFDCEYLASVLSLFTEEEIRIIHENREEILTKEVE